MILNIHKSILAVFVLLMSFSCQNQRITEIEKKLNEALEEIENLKKNYSDFILKKEENNLLKDSLEVILSNLQKTDLSVLYEKLKNSVFVIYTTDDETIQQGTAFLIDANGVCVSNYHVFDGLTNGVIENSYGDRYHIESIIYSNRENDLIIFKIPIQNNYISPLTISTSSPKIGEECFTIGNPMGFNQTISKGIISGFRNNQKMIQITAEITYGSSGGPLFNNVGEVVGITSSGIGDANLNFAVNINQIPSYILNAPLTNSNYSDNFIVIKDRAYFYDEPNKNTRRNAYLIKNDKGNVINRKNGFIYIIYTNRRGQITKGWINIEDISFI
ncbi:MAG TPA: serine protease [Bacteroidales bacterium]|mgnify:CR=1 FL=1|nr:serine protease [Bacteroidales bacterium]HOR81826.1 serine protease [Bacteroidales bacterium]HPJ90941.1 serine protease [Bacteroidales bacterium]